MLPMASYVAARVPKRSDGRIILHFDYDCFYASVFEVENPALKSLPLAVQQKQIVVTCNYKARERGLHKLQLIKDAKRICPDVVVVLGEDLTRFRNASKRLYCFLRNAVWSGKVERLGFDEVFLDVTDMIDYNLRLLNQHDLQHSFFHLDQNDAETGFVYNASILSGPTYPARTSLRPSDASSFQGAAAWNLQRRLILGSHLADYLRHQMEEQLGYTATVGISTNKLLAKLVGGRNKPRNQTTLLPPYEALRGGERSNVIYFVDDYEIGKIPGIGSTLARKLRSFVCGKEVNLDENYVPEKSVSVQQLRSMSGSDSRLLSYVLDSPGAPKDIGVRIWNLIHGIDDAEVGDVKNIPSQISIENSYTRLDTQEQALRQLQILTASLIKRMRTDLVEAEDDQASNADSSKGQIRPAAVQWMAHPRTLRLSTRLRQPTNNKNYNPSSGRVSRSSPMPFFVFALDHSIDALAARLVRETVMPLFHRLHPGKYNWNLNLMNIAATNMVEVGADRKGASGRDIGKMFKLQENMPSSNKCRSSHADTDSEKCPKSDAPNVPTKFGPSEDQILPLITSSQETDPCPGDEDHLNRYECPLCAADMPDFAIAAHQRYHDMPD